MLWFWRIYCENALKALRGLKLLMQELCPRITVTYLKDSHSCCVMKDAAEEEFIGEIAGEETAEDWLSGSRRQEEGSKAVKIVKRAFIVFLALFLIFLLFSYLVPGAHTLRVFEGLLASSSLNDDFSVDLSDGGRVVLEQKVYSELKDLYFENQKNEFKVCLEGEKQGNEYFVSGLVVPETYLKTFSSVSSQICSAETIIPLHSHPYRDCVFSEQDIKSYAAFRSLNPDAIMGLMCEIDRFAFYGFE